MPRFSAEWILPISAPPIHNGELVTGDDGTIVEIRRLPSASASAEKIAPGTIILPALVNAHVHFELSLLGGKVPGGQGLPKWIAALLGARIGIDAAEAKRAAASAISDAIALGTVAIGEITNTLDTVFPIAEAGLAGVIFHELLDLDVPKPLSFPAAITSAVRNAQAKRAALGTWPSSPTSPDGTRPPALTYALTPHAPGTTSPALIAEIMKATPAAPISIHAAEDGAERELLMAGRGPLYDLLAPSGLFDLATIISGLGPIDHLARAGLLGRKIPPILVHMVDTTAEERAQVAAAGCHVALCPRSNLHIGGTLPDVPALHRAGISLCLGTDSLASNASLSIWSEMATLARAFPRLPPNEILGWATLGGSRALGLDGWLGTLEPGKCPGILALTKPGIRPDDPYRFVVAAEPTPVEVSWLSPRG